MKINFEIETKTAVQEAKLRIIEGEHNEDFCAKFIAKFFDSVFGKYEYDYYFMGHNQSFSESNTVIHAFIIDIKIDNGMETFDLNKLSEKLISAFKKVIE